MEQSGIELNRNNERHNHIFRTRNHNAHSHIHTNDASTFSKICDGRLRLEELGAATDRGGGDRLWGCRGSDSTEQMMECNLMLDDTLNPTEALMGKNSKDDPMNQLQKLSIFDASLYKFSV
ncbi:hypothetical protein HELRODRAFT_163025 [Helobdella robusta]|uniref:Uncharacterized protein n=1 Tax=Helobdella robusta TaxID=6412 RepID=T1ETL2_HELRO|nr:hypothetical protein HELRODRAFT_163025 [Helobdella robusta]ESN99475.1 hypothetical protein HELRODRAFT_163025 [Helobdella robusta]